MMQHTEKDDSRNRPSDEGSRNDPNTREESAQQPGVNTYSSSKGDSENQDLTRTASDDFRTEPRDPRADPSFDEVNEVDTK